MNVNKCRFFLKFPSVEKIYVFSTVRGMTRGGKGDTISRAQNHFGGRRKLLTMSQVLSSSADLLPKDFSFEHGGSKLVSLPGCHLTPSRP